MKEKVKIQGWDKLFPFLYKALEGNGKRIFFALLTFMSVYLMCGAELIFETNPLGLALLCAVREYVPMAAAGALLHALVSGGGMEYAAGIIVALGFRYALAYTLDRRKISSLGIEDSLPQRLSGAGAGAFTVAMIRIIHGGFTYYDLIAGTFLTVGAVGCAYVFALGLDREKRYSRSYEAGLAGLMFGAVYALCETEILGFSPGAAAAFLLTMLTARRGGALRGVMAGFMCGAALDIESCPMLAVTGFICGVLTPAAGQLAMPAAVVIGLFCGMYTGGITGILNYMPEAALALCLLIPLEYFGIIPAFGMFRDEVMINEEQGAAAIVQRAAFEDMESRMTALCKIAKTESELLSALSKKERTPSAEEIANICLAVMTEECEGCLSCRICHPVTGRPEYSEMLSLGSYMYGGRMLKGDELTSRPGGCCFAERITGRINVRVSALGEDRLKRDRARTASDGLLLSSTGLEMILEKEAKNHRIDREKTDLLIKKGLYGKLFGKNIAVYGTDNTRIVAVGGDRARIKAQKNEIRKSFEAELKTRFRSPVVKEKNGCAVLTLERMQRFCVSFAQRCSVKDGEIVNGDTVLEAGNEGMRYFALCDGMGSGKEAALSSKLACATMKSLLNTGFSPEYVLKAANHTVGLRSNECFSTVDMFCFNVYTGQGAFYKCGASPSLVLREGRIFRLVSHTPPVGALEEPVAEKIEFEIRDGDTVILISDGIACCDKDIIWLCDLISDSGEGASAEEICELIASYAKETFGCEDDMTVCAVGISLASSPTDI